MNEEILEKVRKDYIHSGMSFGQGNFNDLSNKLGSQNMPSKISTSKVLVALIIPLILLGGVVFVSLNSKSGDTLYPVKVASENIISDIKQKLEPKEKEAVKSIPALKDKENKAIEKEQNKLKEIKGVQENVGTSITPTIIRHNISEKPKDNNGKAVGQEKSQNIVPKSEENKINPEHEKGKSEENKGRGKNN